jgi:hypothetical protein
LKHILCKVRKIRILSVFQYNKEVILKHIAEVGSVRQGDPIAHVVSVLQYNKEVILKLIKTRP